MSGQTLSGRILKGIGGFYYVFTGDSVYECQARGIFRKLKQSPLVGDMAEILVIDKDKKTGSVTAILPRHNEINRPPVANIDILLIVFAPKNPAIDLLLLDKLIISAENLNVSPVICFNKIDWIDSDFNEIVDVYGKLGYPLVCAQADRSIGIRELSKLLAGQITCLAGPSGVGKSTLVNKLCVSYDVLFNPNDVHVNFDNIAQMETGGLGRSSKGKHTTRHAQLLPLSGGGFVVDTPGFTSFELNSDKVNSISSISGDELAELYIEFRPHIGNCRFNDCKHMAEPDCAVKEQLGEAISRIRYDNYVRLYSELHEQRRM